MFGGFGAGAMAQRYAREKYEAARLPHLLVNRTEFRQRWADAGMDGDCEQAIRISEAMESYVRVGGELLQVKRGLRNR